MGELLGFAYFVFGGVVTGQTLFAMWADDAFEAGADGERPFVGILFLAMLFWLAWPVVWGAVRARKAFFAKEAP